VCPVRPSPRGGTRNKGRITAFQNSKKDRLVFSLHCFDKDNTIFQKEKFGKNLARKGRTYTFRRLFANFPENTIGHDPILAFVLSVSDPSGTRYLFSSHTNLAICLSRSTAMVALVLLVALKCKRVSQENRRKTVDKLLALDETSPRGIDGVPSSRSFTGCEANCTLQIKSKSSYSALVRKT
jgi:hypothetical protein